MLRNRIILAVAFLTALIFASCFGGNVPYALLYLTLAVPIAAFLYTFIVYLKFKLNETLESHTIVKGETTKYSFTIANEGLLTYQDLKVNFFSGMSTIRDSEQFVDYCLLPGESLLMESELRCFYRGTYNVGARSVEIVDLFNLFRLRYPVHDRQKVVVLPRIVELSNLNILPLDEDSKNALFRVKAQEENLDIDVRKYVRGDSRRQVHWKSTARRGELMSRQYTENIRLGVIICMDLSPLPGLEELERAGLEDKIIESCIAISSYCMRKNTPCNIYYDYKKIQKMPIRNKPDFDAFYRQCGLIDFHAANDAGGLIKESNLRDDGVFRYIIVTHTLTDGMYTASMQALARGNDVTIVIMRDELPEEQNKLRAIMAQSSIPVMQIQSDEDFSHAFERKVAGGGI